MKYHVTVELTDGNTRFFSEATDAQWGSGALVIEYEAEGELHCFPLSVVKHFLVKEQQ